MFLTDACAFRAPNICQIMQIVAHRLFYPTSGQPHPMSLIEFFTREFTSSKARLLRLSFIILVFVKSFLLKDCEERISIYK